MKNRYILLGLALVIGVIIGALLGYNIGYQQAVQRNISNYQECVDAGYPILESFPEQCKTPDGRSFTNGSASVGQEMGTFEGKIVCLPHIDTEGPQTLECAMGLQTDDNTYYGLSTDSPLDLAETGKRVRIQGSLKTETSTIYQSIGTITVSSVEVI